MKRELEEEKDTKIWESTHIATNAQVPAVLREKLQEEDRFKVPLNTPGTLWALPPGGT